MPDLPRHLAKEFHFNKAKSLYDLIFVNGKQFMRFYDGTLGQNANFQIIV